MKTFVLIINQVRTRSLVTAVYIKKSETNHKILRKSFVERAHNIESKEKAEISETIHKFYGNKF